MPGAGDLDITQPLTIEGNGSTVDAGGIDRVFDVGAVAVIINNLTIRNGVAKGFLSLGGGLIVRGGSLTLNNCTVTANSTSVESGERDAGGGIAAIGSFNAGTGAASLATLTLNGTTVSSNTGSIGGGILCVLCALVDHQFDHHGQHRDWRRRRRHRAHRQQFDGLGERRHALPQYSVGCGRARRRPVGAGGHEHVHGRARQDPVQHGDDGERRLQQPRDRQRR